MNHYYTHCDSSLFSFWSCRILSCINDQTFDLSCLEKSSTHSNFRILLPVFLLFFFLFLFSVVCPRITLNPVSQSVATGTEATFRVEARGDDLEFLWQKDGINIGSNKSRLHCCKTRDISTLHIQHTKKGDKGHYRCIVKNPSEKDGKPTLQADLSVCKFVNMFVLFWL